MNLYRQMLALEEERMNRGVLDDMKVRLVEYLLEGKHSYSYPGFALLPGEPHGLAEAYWNKHGLYVRDRWYGRGDGKWFYTFNIKTPKGKIVPLNADTLHYLDIEVENA